MKNIDLFQSYKPLRNHLRQLNVQESLYTIWAYCNHLQYNSKLPPDINVAQEFLDAKNPVDKHIFEWELETLAREIIMNGTLEELPKMKRLREWTQFSLVVNKLKDLENSIAGKYSNKDIVLVELFRIAHRQFPWQISPHPTSITRYFLIFNDPAVDAIIQRVTGLSVKQITIMSLALQGHFIKDYRSQLPVTNTIEGYTSEQANQFIDRFSCDYEELKNNLIANHKLDESFAYTNLLLRQYPLIKMPVGSTKELYCPMPTLLFERTAGGIYYEVLNEAGFDNAFGKSFENYTGEVIKRAHTNKQIKVYGSEPYKVGKNLKESVDWIIADSGDALFIECKTKRIKAAAKFGLLDRTELDQELSKLADFIVQAYKSINDYNQGLYPHLPYSSQRKVYPVILTLEDWFVFMDPLLDKVDERVKERFAELKLPTQWLIDTPYQICSISTFERLVQIIQMSGIHEFMKRRLKEPDKQKWDLGPFISQEFPEESKKVKFMFDKEFKELAQP